LNKKTLPEQPSRRYHFRMTDFYSRLVEHYDTIFPPEPEIVTFLVGDMKGRRKLLDIACGTGTYANELAFRGFDVTGIDIEERMIERAKEKSFSSGAKFYTADMTGSADRNGVFAEKYDGIYCIGNSLPHLGTVGQVKEAISLWSACLEPGGMLVLQTVNFGRFRSDKESELPSIRRSGLVFSRRYAPAPPGTVDFETALSIPQSGVELSNTVRLLVLRREALDETLKEAGFGSLEYFGGYDRRPYDTETSFLMICTARKL
jgi:2-polyprenyl-3-methyl-5-hydroxy-6-metoxy-1,4-benzoquinol methylase